jgi:hypothetical protein
MSFYRQSPLEVGFIVHSRQHPVKNSAQAEHFLFCLVERGGFAFTHPAFPAISDPVP